jgi:hypothetical protein
MGLTIQYPHLSVKRMSDRCDKCHRRFFEEGSPLPRYLDQTSEHERHREELHRCTCCGQQFLLRHDFYDEGGHLIPAVLSTDPNDPQDQWYTKLAPEQRDTAIKHLAGCPVCQRRLAAETLSDAWFRDFLNQLRSKG